VFEAKKKIRSVRDDDPEDAPKETHKEASKGVAALEIGTGRDGLLKD
jgi:hypothetical protein